MTVAWVAGAAGAAGLAGVCALAVAGLRRRFLVVTVAGISMTPTLRSGDRVLVRRAGLGRISRGDIVVLGPADGHRGPPPDERGPAWVIKRAAALPGDPIPRGAAPALAGVPETEVPPGKLLLLGDNAENSTDSRQTGYFDERRLVGRVVRRISAGRPGRTP